MNKDLLIDRSSCTLVTSIGMLKDVLSFECKAVAVDTETSGLDTNSCDLVGISFYQEGCDRAFYVPLNHKGFSKNLSLEAVCSVFQSLFDSGVRLVFHNFKFDYKILKRAGLSFDKAVIFDTMVCAYLLDAESRHYSLSYLVKEYFGYDMLSFEDLTKLCGGYIDCVDIGEVKVYACEDAYYTFILYEAMLPKAFRFPQLLDVEFALISILADMENVGFRVDVEQLKRIMGAVKVKLSLLEDRIFKCSGRHFNIRSNKQLGIVLRDVFDIKGLKHTRKRAIKVDSGSLDVYLKECDAAKYIIEYKQLSSLLNSFLTSLLDNVVDGKIYCSFNQCIARTGRLSCSKPNLQNIPLASDNDGLVRSCFLPLDSNSLIVSVDYSQIELRLLAHFSRDAQMLDKLNSGVDLHKATASFLFGVSVGDVSKRERFMAKTLNFGIIYGMEFRRLASELDISFSDAKQLLDSFFRRYSGVASFVRKVPDFALKKGYVFTYLERICWINGFDTGNPYLWAHARRQAVNSVIQGSCADLIKKAMIDVCKRLCDNGFHVVLLLQVHDELVFSVPKSEIGVVKSLVKECLENVVSLRVPLIADVGVGKNWYEAKS